MTQDEVFKLLKAENQWMTAKEIARRLETGAGSITANLAKLLKNGDVIKEARTAQQGGSIWKIKDEEELNNLIKNEIEEEVENNEEQ